MSDATQTAADSTTLLGGDATGAQGTAETTTTASTTTATTTEGSTTQTATTGPTAEEKAAAEAKAAADAKAKDDAKPEGAPEKYSDFTLPEGLKLDEAVMGEFQTLARELNLPQAAAQKLVDLGARMQTGNAEQLQATIEAQGEAWGAQAKADKEFGGDKFDQNLAVAKKALDQFATPELKTLLVQSKLGNHPEVLRVFYRMGQQISEDGFVPGRAGASGDPARTMFPNMN